MNKFIKTMALALVCTVVLAFAPSVEKILAAPANATIVINNRPYVPKNTIENINDRLLLPFREISEAIGAEVDWDDASKRIITTYGNRYSIMYINNPTVTYGTYTVDANNTMHWNSDAQALALDVAPRLVGNFTYIPLRAFAETLGADVTWMAQTNTAYINVSTPDEPSTTQPNPSPSPSPSPSADPSASNRPANYDDFTNTSYFKLFASETVKHMYQDSNNKPFVVVVYDSTLESSKRIVPSIQDVAQKLSYRIYGLDMSETLNKESDNEWLWSFFNKNSAVDPTIYFVHSKSKVEQMQAPTDFKEVEAAINKFQAQSETGVSYGDFGDTTYFKNKSDTYIQQQVDLRKEFIVVLYDKADEDSKYHIPFIKAAAKDKQVEVYGVDIDRYPRFYSNVDFMKNYRYEKLPVLFLVYSDMDDTRSYSQPSTVDRVKDYIDEFNRNKYSTGASAGYSDVIDSRNVYRNADITDLRARFNNSEEFVLFIYDSSVKDYEKVVDDFVYYASLNDTIRNSNIKLYGVNRNSSVYKNNLDKSNYDWLSINTLLSYYDPILVHLRNKDILDYNYYADKTYTKVFNKVLDMMD